MKKSNISKLVLGAAVIGIAAMAVPAQAEYPEKPFRIVIPFGPGGTTDTVFRTLQPYLTKTLGTQVVIVNTKGAGGTVGTQAVIDSKPDGYTVGTLQTNTMIAQAVGLGKYKDGDYEPTVSIGDMPLTLAVKGDSPYMSIKDFQDAAEKAPGKIGLAMGIGTLAHFVAKKTENSLGVDLKLVNAGGGAKKKAAVMGGHVAGLIDPPPGVLGMHKAGKLRVIAVFGPERLATMPDVKTAKEQGVDLIAYQTKGFFVPKGTPAAIKKKIGDAVCALDHIEELQQKMRDLSVIWSCKQGAEYVKYIDGVRADVNALAKQMGY